MYKCNRKVIKTVIIVLIFNVFTIDGFRLPEPKEDDYRRRDSARLQDTPETSTSNPPQPEAQDKDELMDIITIVWYFSTFVALIVFFLYMAFAAKCRRKKPEEATPPVTPAPDYKNFAPPSYDTAIKKMQGTNRVYIVPVHGENNFFNNITSNPTNASSEPSSDNRNSLHL